MPKTDPKLVQIRVPDDLWQKVQERAARYRLPVNQWVRSLIETALSRQVREAWSFDSCDPPNYVTQQAREHEVGGTPIFVLAVFSTEDSAQLMEVEVAAKVPGQMRYEVLSQKGLLQYEVFKVRDSEKQSLWIRGSGFWSVREIRPLTYGAHVLLHYEGKKPRWAKG